jgi:plasmid maintenance system antidote protein VapI
MKSNNLEVLRKELGLNKKSFATELSITQNAYTNYIKGTRLIPTDLAIKIQ